MDPTTEKNILEEISTLVYDSQEKVTMKNVSNNWMIKNELAKDMLTKWLEMNKKKSSEVAVEFLIAGVNPKGVVSFGVVSEDIKDKAKKCWKNFKSFIYSVELKTSSRQLNLPDYEPIKVKNILINPGQPRDLHIPQLPDPVIKQEPVVKQKPAAKTPFNVIKPAAKVEAKEESVEKPKKEAEKPKKEVAKPKESPEKMEVTVKTEKTSPEESKTASKATAAKKGVKNQKPVQKGSISSFFNNKPGTSKAAEPPKPKLEPVKSQDEPMSVDDESPDEVVEKRKKTPEKKKEPEKKKPTKKIKLKESANNKKRSRIRVMEDSSEEEEEKNDSDEPDTKFIKFDREFTPDKEDTQKVPDSPAAKTPEKVPEKRKAKRYVKKRFQTEDGFMRTETVLEEYSADEEEETVNDENKKKNSPPKKTPPTKEKTEKKSAEKKKTAAKPAQSSKITSFFTKK